MAKKINQLAMRQIISLILQSIMLFAAMLSCNGPVKNEAEKIYTDKEIQEQIKKAKAGSIAFTGRFYRIDKLNNRDYVLQLKAANDTVVSFITMMPLGEEEIQRLKKSGDNIEIYYNEYYNPVKKRKDKIVNYTRFIYEDEKK